MKLFQILSLIRLVFHIIIIIKLLEAHAFFKFEIQSFLFEYRVVSSSQHRVVQFRTLNTKINHDKFEFRFCLLTRLFDTSSFMYRIKKRGEREDRQH